MNTKQQKELQHPQQIEVQSITDEENGKEDPGNVPMRMWAAAFLIALQSFSFGYIFSCLNACLVAGNDNDPHECTDGEDSSCPKGTIYNDINLTTEEAQIATSLTILSAWIGCFLANKPADYYGKRITLLCNNVFFLAGAVLTSSGSVYALYIGRFISGIGVGVASSIPAVLLAEVATPATRGVFTTLHQVMLTFGIFISGILGYAFVTYVSHGWQYIQGFSALPGCLMLLLYPYVPESPKWLLAQAANKNNTNSSSSSDVINPVTAASAIDDDHGCSKNNNNSSSDLTYAAVKAMLLPLRPAGYDVDRELRCILREQQQQQQQQQQEGGASEVTWAEVFSYKKSMVIGVGLLLFQAITGINTVVFYSTTIFGLAGFSQSIIGTACFGTLNFLTTVLCCFLVDRVGRKILLLVGTYIMVFALVVVGAVLLSPMQKSIQGIVAVLGVLVYVFGYAIGLGAVVWPVTSEITPTRVRVKAVTLFLNVNWGSNLLIGLLTLTAIDGLGGVNSSMDDDQEADAQKKGVAILYIIFAAISFACLLFLHGYVPETKGKTPEQILAGE